MLSPSWCRKSSRQALLTWLPEAARFSFCKHSSSFPPDYAGLLSLRAKIATPFGVAICLGRLEQNILPSAAIEMVGYLTMTLIASFLLRKVEKLLDGSDSYELAQGDQLVMAAGTYSHPDRGTPFDEVNREYTGEEKRNRIRIGLKNRNGSTRGGR